MKYPNFNIGLDRQEGRKRSSRLFPFLLLFFLALAFPQRMLSQSFDPLISFSVESCSLDEALGKLFAEYELNVAFSKEELSKIRIESYSCSYKSVEEVLSDLLKGTDYGYKKIGRQYVIRKKQVFEPVIGDEPVENPIVIKPKETEQHKIDTVLITGKTTDTVRIYDTLQVIRTVMRYDTVVKMKVVRDTVRTIVHEGLMIPWPRFRDNGWFFSASLATSPSSFKYENGFPEIENGSLEVVPITGYTTGLDGGYKHNRFSVGMSLSYRSTRYRFLLEKTDFAGDYFVNDTLDTYYVVHPAGDTVFHYIMDSTYIPLTTTNYAYRDVNRLDYLSVGLFATFDFIKMEHFRAFWKVGASADFLVNYAGSLNATESPYHTPIVKDQVEPIRFSFYGGIGAAFKVADRIELVPEMQYHFINGKLYRADFPFNMKMQIMDFRLGLTYYF